MAKVSRQDHHDWIGLKATFPSGHVANVTLSRNGTNVTVKPDAPRAAETLSIVVDQSCKRTREAGYVASDYGKLLDVMEGVAKSSTSLDGYLDGLKAALSVTGTVPKPEGSADALGTAGCSKKRGWVVSASFPDGASVELTVNKSSVGIRMKPEAASNASALTKMVFAVKNLGAHDDEAIARTLASAAGRSGDVVGWIEEARSSFLSPVPRA